MALEPSSLTVDSAFQFSTDGQIPVLPTPGTPTPGTIAQGGDVVSQITDGSIQAPATPGAISQGGNVSSTISDGQIQAPTKPSQTSVARTEDLIPERHESTASPSTVNVTSVPAPSGQQSVRFGLPVASKVGMGVGVVLAAIVLCGLFYFLHRRSRQRRQIQHDDNKFIKHPEQATTDPQVTAREEDAKPVELPLSYPTRPEIDGNPLHEAPSSPKSRADSTAKSIAKGSSTSRLPINQLRSHRDKEDLSKLGQKERQLQEEISRLEKLGRLKTEREESTRNTAMADEIDNANAAAILATQSQDIDDLTGEYENGEIITDDAQLALRVYKEDLEGHVISMRDYLLATLFGESLKGVEELPVLPDKVTHTS
ncbi:MAG: hypothetical protein Q9213_001102 [Squamulea squamosa]